MTGNPGIILINVSWILGSEIVMQSVTDDIHGVTNFPFSFHMRGHLELLSCGLESLPVQLLFLMTARCGLRVKDTVWGQGLIWPPSAQKLSRYVERLTSVSLLV